MSRITLCVKHPHGRMTVIAPLDPLADAVPLPESAGRRPVVALVDAAVGRHPWLAAPTVVTTLPSDAATPGPAPEHGTPPPFEAPVSEHGTFDAGIIRQLAPGAEILSVPVLTSAGDIAHRDVLRALTAITERVADGSAATFVDVVCLPFGYLADETTPEHMVEERRLLGDLAERGVLLVAAAGNEGSTQKVFPAAFAPELLVDGHPMLSVGALDLDGRPARYSGSGSWVTRWEAGFTTSIVADPAGGFAVGEGTSFAATRVAAKLAAGLSSDPTLSDVTPAAAVERAGRAVARLA